MIADSLCVTSWRARPASFVGLMTLYESNYVRLRGLAGDLRGLAGRRVSSVPADCDLHMDAIEHSPYTTVFRLTYFFGDEPDRVEILSGLQDGLTLGTPIGMLVRNRDQRPGDYGTLRDVPRPLSAGFGRAVRAVRGGAEGTGDSERSAFE